MERLKPFFFSKKSPSNLCFSFVNLQRLLCSQLKSWSEMFVLKLSGKQKFL